VNVEQLDRKNVRVARHEELQKEFEEVKAVGKEEQEVLANKRDEALNIINKTNFHEYL
jgi:hypothetical protein